MTTRKKIFIIILILSLVGGVFFFFRQRQIAKQSSQTRSFRDFFTFSKKITTGGGDAGTEQGGDFTTDGKTEVKEDGSTSSSQIRTAFGTNQPFSPTSPDSTNGPTDGGFGDAGGQLDNNNGGGNGATGGDTGGGQNPNDPPAGPGDLTPTIPDCTVDDLEITFTPEELAQLKALEQEFYAIAPTLRTDQDVQLEDTNYAEYKILQDRMAELADSCENITTKIPETLDRKVATPFYSDSKKDAYFIDGPTPGDNVINMNCRNANNCSRAPLVLRWLERIFRINIW